MRADLHVENGMLIQLLDRDDVVGDEIAIDKIAAQRQRDLTRLQVQVSNRKS